MKKHLIFMLGVVITVHPTIAATLSECSGPVVSMTPTAICSTKTSGYACAECYTTSYTCPTGWSSSGTSTCSRAATTLTADSKGYRQQNYGTCDATESKTYVYAYYTDAQWEAAGSPVCRSCALQTGTEITIKDL